MVDGGSIDEKLRSNDFVNDFVWAARAVFAQPSVAVVSIVLWTFPAVLSFMPKDKLFTVSLPISVLVLACYLGWCGAERIFFRQRREGKAITLLELLKSTPDFMGRFMRLGFLTSAVLSAPSYIAGRWAIAHGLSQTQVPSHVVTLLYVLILVPVDFALTFVPSALVFTTESSRQAIRIGGSMIRRTWPRCALYVVCPPLALNMLNTIYPTEVPVVRVVTTAALALLALLAKGATARFYLRERSVQ